MATQEIYNEKDPNRAPKFRDDDPSVERKYAARFKRKGDQTVKHDKRLFDLVPNGEKPFEM